MAIIEIHGGPITHRYLIGKTKDELARLYMRLLQDTEQDAKDAERYRWLRGLDGSCDSAACVNFNIGFDWIEVHGVELDEAIDTAMKGANT